MGKYGAMIATAAEKNPSCFRGEADGGILPWQPVVEQYVRTSMDVHNRFGNTKYLLAQMVPGKEKFHQPVNQAKSYADVCKTLGLEHLVPQAKETDARCGLDQPKDKESATTTTKNKRKKKKGKKSNASALAAGGRMVEARETCQHRKLGARSLCISLFFRSPALRRTRSRPES